MNADRHILQHYLYPPKTLHKSPFRTLLLSPAHLSLKPQHHFLKQLDSKLRLVFLPPIFYKLAERPLK